MPNNEANDRNVRTSGTLLNQMLILRRGVYKNTPHTREGNDGSGNEMDSKCNFFCQLRSIYASNVRRRLMSLSALTMSCAANIASATLISILAYKGLLGYIFYTGILEYKSHDRR